MSHWKKKKTRAGAIGETFWLRFFFGGRGLIVLFLDVCVSNATLESRQKAKECLNVYPIARLFRYEKDNIILFGSPATALHLILFVL